jgi:hypothetical protein
MPKAANSLHCDQISTAQAGVAKSVVGRDPRAEKRSGFRRREFIRNRSDGACFRDHHFRISSIRGYSRYHGVLTIHTVSAPARFAHTVFAGNEADTNPLTNLPFGYSVTQGFDAANHFVSRNPRQSQTGVDSHHGGGIGVADSASFYPNADLTRSRLGDLPLHYSKLPRFMYFYCLVCICHVNILLIFTSVCLDLFSCC